MGRFWAFENGDSVVIIDREGKPYHEWRIIEGELIDTAEALTEESKKDFEEKGDKSSSERMTAILEQVSNKTYSLENLGNDICGFIELKNIFE